MRQWFEYSNVFLIEKISGNIHIYRLSFLKYTSILVDFLPQIEQMRQI